MNDIEKFDILKIAAISTISFIFVAILLLSGAYSASDNSFIQATIEEICRILFCFIVFRISGLLLYPSIAFATSEVIFASFINYYLFSPEYFDSFSTNFIVAIMSISCTFLVGIIAGLLYIENIKSGNSIFWALLFTVPLRYIIHWFPESAIVVEYGNSYDAHFYVVYAIFLLIILIAAYKRLQRQELRRERNP